MSTRTHRCTPYLPPNERASQSALFSGYSLNLETHSSISGSFILKAAICNKNFSIISETQRESNSVENP